MVQRKRKRIPIKESIHMDLDLHDISKLVELHLPDGNTLLEKIKALLSIKTEKPIAIVYGVYNAGKSSLLNSLTEHVKSEFFATGDVPETNQNKSLEYNGLCFIDTPGIDVNDHDSSEANFGALQSDIILYVHRLSAGSLQALDIEAMAAISKKVANKDRIFFVLTEAEIKDKNIEVIEEITQQIREKISPNITAYLVSNTMFKKGFSENKPALLLHSGIPKLRDELTKVAQIIHNDLQADRKNAFHEALKELRALVQKQKDKLKQEQKIEQKNLQQFQLKFVSNTKGFQQKLKKKLEELTSI